MDRRLLRYYNRELSHIRESAGEFAKEFPKVAGRLGLEQFECADPYVERLLEGFAFLAARVQLKLDAEFPRFTQGLLETVYPHYLAPSPSCVIAQFKPELAEPALAAGVRLERDRALKSQIGKGDTTACEYRTAHPVTLWPLEITAVEYHTRGLGALGVPGTTALGAKAGLKIRLRATAGLKISAITIDRLPIFLHGGGPTPGRLYEQLLAHAVAVSVQPVRTPVPWAEVATNDHDGLNPPVRRVGYSEEEALLPFGARSFQGYRLLHEYFMMPQRFWFAELCGLARGFARCDDEQVDVIVLLKSADQELENQVGPANVQLFCTPAVNLFPKRLDRIHVSDRFAEFHAVADRTRPMDFEVWQVDAVYGYAEGAQPIQEFRPFYKAADDAYTGETGRAFFALNRVPRVLSEREQLQGRRSSYAGSEVFVSLVDAHAAPYRPDVKQLGLEGRCTNRDLPLRMPVGRGGTDFKFDDGGPIESIKVLVGPTLPRPSFAEGETAWRLISHLALNYFSIADGRAKSGGVPPGPAGGNGAPSAASAVAAGRDPGVTPGAGALRDLLKLYSDQGDAAMRKQIEGVRAVESKPIVRRVNTPGPIAFARGLEIGVVLDEPSFEGVGPFLIGSVLDHFFARYVSLNSFTETVVRTPDRGEIMRWPARIGQRQIV